MSCGENFLPSHDDEILESTLHMDLPLQEHPEITGAQIGPCAAVGEVRVEDLLREVAAAPVALCD